MTMKRDAALAALIPHIGPRDIVVAVYQTCFDWLALNPRPLNYVAVGAMGQAGSHGLGLALANPDRNVIVLDGDGSLLMNLGALVTLAGAGVDNLAHLVFVNRVYEVNGAQPLPGAERIDFAGIARGAGLSQVASFDDLDSFEAGIGAFLACPGPRFAALDIEPGAAYPPRYDYIHSRDARASFRAALMEGQGEGG